MELFTEKSVKKERLKIMLTIKGSNYLVGIQKLLIFDWL